LNNQVGGQSMIQPEKFISKLMNSSNAGKQSKDEGNKENQMQ
jgi:hypothetical protein